MAYSTEFLRVTWMFTVNGTTEIADTSLNFTATAATWTLAGESLDELDSSDAHALGDAYLTMVDGLGWANYSKLAGVKIAAFQPNGDYVVQANNPIVWLYATPTAGTLTNRIPQGTTVLTLRSSMNLGQGNFGRMYLPHFYGDLESGLPRAAKAYADTLGARAVTFLAACEDQINGSITTSIVKASIMSQAGASTHKAITRVAVGRVVDTQRKRRNALDEDYSLFTR